MTILENLSLAENKGKMYGLGRAVNRRRMQDIRQCGRLCGR